MTENNEGFAGEIKSDLMGWGAPFQVAVCESCDWSFLIPPGYPANVCPHCFQPRLEPSEDETGIVAQLAHPELILPHKMDEAGLNQKIENFTRGIPFASSDLRLTNLRSRLIPLFLPVWLVDLKAKATWQAEMGFNYNVVSHQERYEQNRGNWQTQQIEEQRIRWEPRVGRLDRAYQNIAAPALENYMQLRKAIGRFDFQFSRKYSAQDIVSGIVCLPNRSKQDTWQSLFPDLQSIAADECRQACEADRVRQYSWAPNFEDHHWTLLLQPAFTTYYLDDEQKVQPVLINGQNGQLFGVRRASMKKAKQASLYILITALIVFSISLGSLVLSPLIPLFAGISAIGAVAAFAIALAALIPVTLVWWFNRNQEGS